MRGLLLFQPDGSRPGDGDTIRLVEPVLHDEDGRATSFRFRNLSSTTASLPVRLLGIDTPEETYSGGAVPGFPMRGLRRLASGVPQQDPWSRQAKEFTDGFFVPGDVVTVELDEQLFDRNRRLLGYAFRGDDRVPEAHLNLQLLLRGWAALYQVYPNLAHVDEFRGVVEQARAHGRGIWPAMQDERPLTMQELQRREQLNPPFVYRKAIDSILADAPIQEVFRRTGRWVADLDTRAVYPPEQWWAVPHPRRVFYDRREDALADGFRPVKRRPRRSRVPPAPGAPARRGRQAPATAA